MTEFLFGKNKITDQIYTRRINNTNTLIAVIYLIGFYTIYK